MRFKPIPLLLFLVAFVCLWRESAPADNAPIDPASHGTELSRPSSLSPQLARIARYQTPPDGEEAQIAAYRGSLNLSALCGGDLTSLCYPTVNPAARLAQQSYDLWDRIKGETYANDLELQQAFADTRPMTEVVSQKTVVVPRSNSGFGKQSLTNTPVRKTIIERKKVPLPLSPQEKQKRLDKYNHLLASKMLPRIFTPRRMQIAQGLFAEAKATLVAYLQDRRKLIDESGNLAARDKLDEMMAKVNETELVFTLWPDSEGVTRSAHGLLSSKSSKVNIGGMILYVDSVPEAAFTVLLHELGHVIGGRYFPFPRQGAERSHPFGPEIACLGRPDTIGASTQNLEEAFADYVSWEAYLKHLQLSPSDPNALAQLSRGIADRCSRYHQFLLGRYRPKVDDHFDDYSRINRIFLAPPSVKAVIPCPAESTWKISRPTTPIDPAKRGYCSPELWNLDAKH